MHADRRREQASAAAVENCSVRVGRIERELQFDLDL